MNNTLDGNQNLFYRHYKLRERLYKVSASLPAVLVLLSNNIIRYSVYFTYYYINVK